MKADRAQARSRGEAAAVTDGIYDAEWEAAFYEKCEPQAKRSREIIEAEIERLAQLSPIDYELERKGAADRLDIRPAVLDGLVKARRPKKAVKSATPDIDPNELRRAADHIIKHPDILSLFAQEFSEVVAGEAVNGKLLYLVATSRLLDKTMNAAIKGTSAGGKSEIRKRVLEFFPPEDVVTFTSLSEKSLIFYDGDFTHKILSMGEATATDEQSFQDYLLRELMSEGCIRHSTAQKVGNDIKTVTIEKQGPVAFLVTTTKNKMHPENETRMLSLEIDDTEGQTRKVLDKIAQVDGVGDTAPVDHKPWQDFQRRLAQSECRVVVPFAAAMVELIPPVAVRLRRDVGQVIRAIKAHALLHREQRSRDGAGRIIADIEQDYAVVRKLMNAVVAEGSGVAVNAAMTETIDAVAKATIGMMEAEGACVLDIARALKLDKSAAWRRLSAARQEGFVVNLEQRKGLPSKYRVADQKPERIDILPAAAELAEQFNNTPDPPKLAQQCNSDEKAEVSLKDNCCVSGCTVAMSHATVTPLNGNGKSPTVARLHDFSGGDPFVCEHCGAPATAASPVQRCAVDGEEFLLHRECQHDWLEREDLSIPSFLKRITAQEEES